LTGLGQTNVTSLNLTVFFTFEVDEETCELSFNGALAIQPEIESPLLNSTTFGEIELDADDGLSIAESIEQSCNEAKNAFTEDLELDCCDLARTCDPSHRIVLYEGNGCTQNIAGTLGLPGGAQSNVIKTSDQQCLANDEARSVQFNGPLPSGTVLEAADNSDSWCVNDYSFMRLERDLLEGEFVCVDSFTRWFDCPGRPNEDYYRISQAVNELDGKVSVYRVTNPGDSLSPEPECRNRAVAFFEGNGCSQNMDGDFDLPDRSIGGCDLIGNDESRSMKLTGPIPAGFRIDVADSCGDLCEDDWASIVLRDDIPSGEEHCICGFQTDLSTDDYEMKYSGGNGLDGKISYIFMRIGENVLAQC